MVLSNLITSLMKKFLSPFIEDFNADQLNLFGWSGKFSLSNVNIKQNAFDSLRLPFRITHGYIGQIEAEVPWLNIYTEPIIIRINDVNAVIVPNIEVEYDEKEEQEYEWQLKKVYLQNIELIKLKIEEMSGKNEIKDDGFFMKLMAAAIKNIQIFINNVHLCYEDYTSSTLPFQMGVSFTRLIFQTELELNDKNSDKNLIKKIIKLDKFSFYLNYHKLNRYHGQNRQTVMKRFKEFFEKEKNISYIFAPIDFYTFAKINRKPEASNYSSPICDLDMHLSDFQIFMNNYQIRSIIFMLDSIDRMRVASTYRKWRPKSRIKG